ncbi:MAG TPA: DEAD/DEAH box helicase [Albidovulum sp.]|uniref:SNF2-related protein n=1 Tax=Albidovulum sp. TaxID=1872424 RepID=UPI002CF23C07|nr:DEAD/DEAH box helicase [Albidovulum sp.]
MSDLHSFDPYHVFIATAHALRRRAERGALAMGATFGVAAEPLPFQLATVTHILSDQRIRHLIADEVGLGKTIQAIMVLNALRSVDPAHQTAIVAPERLLAQWHEELWTRGHILGHVVDDTDRARMQAWLEAGAAGLERADDDHPAARHRTASALLLRPRDIADHPDWLDPVRQHMLVIDEPQSLPREVLDRLSQKADESRNDEAAYRQLLVLSATPRLGDPVWRDIIFRLLEPEKARLAQDLGLSATAFIEQRELQAAQALVGLPSDVISNEGAIAYRCEAPTRRITRQSRADWGAYFPARDNQLCLFDPNASEIGRLRLIQTLVAGRTRGDGGTAPSLDAAPWTTVRGLLRSRRSVRDAIDRFERTVPGMVQVRKDALEDFGDSRLEALTDILAGIFGAEKDRERTGKPARAPEKIVVVAGDAGTIDMLQAVLPRYFPDLAPDGIAALRRSMAASESSFEDIRAMQQAIEPFVQGPARILLIGDWIQAGLNLQHSARNMIFYSMPWDPQAVDQLIGRIDRLSQGSIRAARHGHHMPACIRLWRLVMRGSPEEGLSNALGALGVFDSPLPPVSEEIWTEVNQLVAQLLTHPETGKGAALARLSDLKATWAGRGLVSHLDHFAPLSKAQVQALADRVGDIADRLHLADEHETSAAERVEAANDDWLRACAKAGGFLYEPGRPDKSDPPRRYSGFWYASGKTEPPFLLTDMAQGHEWDDKVALLVRRKHMAVPPHRFVQFNAVGTQTRDLRFFDHGDSIHDGLCQGWLGFGGPNFSVQPQGELVIRVGETHPALAWNGQPIVVTLAASHPLQSPHSGVAKEFAAALDWFGATARQSYLARLDEGLAADHRWIQSLMPTRFSAMASVLTKEGWHRLDQRQTAMLLRAMPDPDNKSRIQGRMQRLLTPAAAVCSQHVSAIDAELRDLRTEDLRHAITAWTARKKLIEAESGTLAQVFRNRAAARGRVDNQSMVNALRGQVEADERRATLAVLMAQTRIKLTGAAIAAAIQSHPRSLMHASLRFVAPEGG